MTNYDVLFVADHFIMVTTVITDYNPDEHNVESNVENAAWKRLADEYGDEWVSMTNRFINKVSITMQESSIPTPGDPEDAGMER